jgi:hypothetical protein
VLILLLYEGEWFLQRREEEKDRKEEIQKQLEEIYENNEQKDNIYRISLYNTVKELVGSIEGTLNPAEVQFIINKISVSTDIYPSGVLYKKMIKSVINNLETKYPDIDIIYWEVPKDNYEFVKTAFDLAFDLVETTRDSFNMIYNLTNISIGD